MIASKNTPYFAIGPRKFHRFWWTCIPALPTARDSREDRMLRRVWADHTMNTLRLGADGSVTPNARSFYVEGNEDHVVPALFQTWAILPAPAAWAPDLLSALGVEAVGEVRTVRWSYLFEQPYDGKKFCIADIVLFWQDDAGASAVVIETKVRGGSLTTKDISGLDRYLSMPSIRSLPRRRVALVVDEADAAKIRAATGDAYPVATWQTIIGLQIQAVRASAFDGMAAEDVAAVIHVHARHHGIEPLPAWSPPELHPHLAALGTPESYARLRGLGTPLALEAFLLGSEAAFASRRGIMPTPPYDWLAEDPDALSLFLAAKAGASTKQSTADRRVAHWRGD